MEMDDARSAQDPSNARTAGVVSVDGLGFLIMDLMNLGCVVIAPSSVQTATRRCMDMTTTLMTRTFAKIAEMSISDARMKPTSVATSIGITAAIDDQ